MDDDLLASDPRFGPDTLASGHSISAHWDIAEWDGMDWTLQGHTFTREQADGVVDTRFRHNIPGAYRAVRVVEAIQFSEVID